jgi:hypothetical protein
LSRASGSLACAQISRHIFLLAVTPRTCRSTAHIQDLATCKILAIIIGARKARRTERAKTHLGQRLLAHAGQFAECTALGSLAHHAATHLVFVRRSGECTRSLQEGSRSVLL